MLKPLLVLFILLAGWTVTTYLVKEASKQFIKEELTNFFEIGKMFFLSLKSLILVLSKYSLSSDFIEDNPIDFGGLGEQPLKFVDPIEAVETTGTIPSMKVVEDDTVISSLSPESVEVIADEEEKVA